MLVPAMFDVVAGNSDWQVFVASSVGLFFLSLLGYFATRSEKPSISRRGIFVFVTAIWVVFSAASALPFMLSDLRLSFTDAFFEAASGLTTTGSTVLSGLDDLPPGILLWRSMTQWIGGLGIVVLGISLLPFMRSGGQQLFSLESSDKSEKPFPHARQYAERIALIYGGLTLACMSAYMALGMGPFDALNHAMTTVSTGGYSTSDGSMGTFGTTPILLASSLFMFIGGLPFLFLIRLTAANFSWDIQIGYFLYLVGTATAAIVVYRAMHGAEVDIRVLATTLFNVISVITTTGYASEDYQLWGPAIATVFFFMTFLGACAGSTAGGFKQFRIVISSQIIRRSLVMAVRPHQIVAMRYGNRLIDQDLTSSVMIFAFLYAITFIVFAVAYSFFGLDVATAISASATAIANVGPGIGGVIGPAGNFAGLPDIMKWMLCWEMIVGRLEIIAVYALLLPSFWRA